MTVCYCYVLIDPITDCVRYVGKTVSQPKIRLYGHLKPSQRREHTHKNCWINSLLEKGHKPILQVVEQVESDNILDHDNLEMKWVKYYREQGAYLTNATDGGGGSFNPTPETREKMKQSHLGKKWAEKRRKSSIGRKHSEDHKRKIAEKSRGRKHSEETKKKLSEIMKANPPMSFLGKHHTEDTKEKIRQANLGNKIWLGRKHSEEAIKKISDGHKGKVVSEETRKKISNTLKGRKQTKEFCEKVSKATKGKNTWSRGRKLTEEHKQKVSERVKLWWANRKQSKNNPSK